MLNALKLLFILFLSPPLFAGSEAIKTEYELKISLTQSGFNKFKKIFIEDYNAEESSRLDLYFDIFSDHHFILKDLSDPIKLRFQSKRWQVQKSHTLAPYRSITAKFSESLALEINDGDYDNIHKDIEDFHQELKNLDSHALISAGEINKQLLNLKLLKKMKSLCPQCDEDQAYYSSQMNQKQRYKIKIPHKDIELAAFIGVTTTDQTQSFELEAELKNSSDIKLAQNVLADWLVARGLNTSDINTAPAVDSTLITEKNLNQLLNP